MGFGNKKNYNENVIPLPAIQRGKKREETARETKKKRKTFFREGKIDMTQ
jgi:hypothetical protein